MDYLTTKQFEKFYTQKFKRLNGNLVLLHFIPASDITLGISISKSLKLNAVGRNKLKRWTREFFVKNHYSKKYWINIVFTKKPNNYQELSQDLKQVFDKLR